MTDASNIASRRKAFVESCLLVIEERARENGSLFGAAGKDMIAHLGTLQEKNQKLLLECRLILSELGVMQDALKNAKENICRAEAASVPADVSICDADRNALASAKTALTHLQDVATEKTEAGRKLVACTQIVQDTHETTIAMLRAVERVKGCIRKLAETEPERLVGGLRELARQIRTATELRRKSRAQTCHHLDTYGAQNVESVQEGVETGDPRKGKTVVDIDFENLVEMAKEIRNLT